MRTGKYGGQRTTYMADARNEGALRRDPQPEVAGGAGGVPAGPVHAGGAGGDGAPLVGGAPGRPRPALHGDRGEDERLDDDGDAGGALAPSRRGRLPVGPRSPQERDDDRLRIAVPVKGDRKSTRLNSSHVSIS